MFVADPGKGEVEGLPIDAMVKLKTGGLDCAGSAAAGQDTVTTVAQNGAVVMMIVTLVVTAS